MRIVQLTPGSGGSFYCENCLRDAALVTTMRALGHDVLMVPMYLPLAPEKNRVVANAPLFFGGLNVYLQQKLAIFRKTPRWIDRLFDSPSLLRRLAGKAGMTSARDLGESTISMLKGEHGHQTKELQRLIAWLTGQQETPDIVCLSNILLAGLAPSIKSSLGVPVVCLLQDEDGFIDGLDGSYSKRAWEMIAERSEDIDAFIAVSRYYAGVMERRLRLDKEKVHVVYTGISMEGYAPAQRPPEAPTIGYLSRMCADRGLDTLVEAFIRIKSGDRLKNARLRIAGGERGDDEAFIDEMRRKLAAAGVIDDAEFLDDFDRDVRRSFLQSLSVLSVPEKKPVACGLYVLEALAAGVPVVEPAMGVFPEIMEMTGGCVLYDPDAPGALAAAIERLLLDAQGARSIGLRGRAAVSEKLTVEQTTAEMLRIYEQLLK
ncbi:MAG: glycosyltransferase family 4 protein [Phycisphaerales bacterium]|nr:MAG: glycosyltransferase family 4 protein [Phycisphaerales bacterium]